jgi:hypothetical protein
VVIGSNVYVLGGTDGTLYLSEIAAATMGSNGLLGNFTTMDKNVWRLAVTRSAAAVAVAGHAVVVIGGYNATSAQLPTIERAVLP